LEDLLWNALLGQRVQSSGVKKLCTTLVDSHVLSLIFFTLKSQITPTFAQRYLRSKRSEARANGLQGMRERAARIAGKLTVVPSSPSACRQTADESFK
jgi:hypothetical protein